MILSGFQEEHQLLDWYEQDSISALQYIEHHSIGMINRFKKWCQESGSSEDEESAKDFWVTSKSVWIRHRSSLV